MSHANHTNYNSEMIRAEAATNHIGCLVHFTPAANVAQILEHGLLSRHELEKRNLLATYTDAYRLDGQMHGTSLSISFPNYKMFYAKRCRMPMDWAVIVIDPSVLWGLPCNFYAGNAAARMQRDNACDRTTASALASMFTRYSNTDQTLPFQYTTDPQAEVMTFAPVDSSLFHAVLFENQNALLKTKLVTSQRTASTPMMVNRAVFTKRF